MKVIFLTEGGKDIGFGHITRCVSLYEAFEEKEISPVLIINGDKSILSLLENKNHQMFNWLKQEKKLFRSIRDADFIVIDSYLADKTLYEEISGTCNRASLVMIDDFKRFEYPKGFVVNASIYGNKLGYPKNDDIIYLLGKDYIILRKEFWGPIEKTINEKVKNILVAFGGMNHDSFIRKVLDYLKGRFNFTFNVIDAKENKVNAHEMADLMLDADVCISGGGQTTYELARCGVPTIAICFADNQIFNLKGWSQQGFLEFIGRHNEPDLFKKIEEILQRLDYKRRNEMSRVGQVSVDGEGARRIVREVLK